MEIVADFTFLPPHVRDIRSLEHQRQLDVAHRRRIKRLAQRNLQMRLAQRRHRDLTSVQLALRCDIEKIARKHVKSAAVFHGCAQQHARARAAGNDLGLFDRRRKRLSATLAPAQEQRERRHAEGELLVGGKRTGSGVP